MGEPEDDRDDVTPVEIKKHAIGKLAGADELEDTRTRLVRANDALVLVEMQNILRRQAERDLVIDDLRRVVDMLAAGQVAAIESIQRLQRAHDVLRRQQSELFARQQIIAEVCDTYAKRIEEETRARERLTAEVADRD